MSSIKPFIDYTPFETTDFQLIKLDDWYISKDDHLPILDMLSNEEEDQLTLLIALNQYVNVIPYKREAQGRDHWKSPEEFFSDYEGDCEDFCVAKYALLAKAGLIDPAQDRVIVGMDVDDVAHAVLLHNEYILDNRTPIVRHMSDVSYFRPLYGVTPTTIHLYT
tara:strand:- start:236 stop:727 length:492 start_codon:yes stop_codon:yes gene_type:complete